MKFKVISLYLVAAAVCIFICGMGTDALSKEAAFTPWISTASLKIFPDDKPPAEIQSPYKLLAARNEFVPFQVAINANKDLKDVNVTVSDFDGGNGKLVSPKTALYLVVDVTIDRPSIAATRKVWPDPLPPYHEFDIKAGETKSVWVDLFVPMDAKPGTFKATATISADGAKVSLPLSLDVRNVTIPEVPTLRTAFGINFGCILEAHKMKAKDGTPEALALKDAYYWMLVNHRMSPYSIPVDFFSEDAHKYLDDPRVNFLRAPFSWNKDDMQKIADRMKSTGWINKAVYYERDEPSSEAFAEVNNIGKWLHSFNPDLKYLITTGYTPALKEAKIDIWCPALIFTLDPNKMKGLRAEMARGKKLWWYTCIGPKWEGTDYFIDEGATSPRALTWMNLLYGVTGVLYWETTSWGSVDFNPWNKTETYHMGNGDGSLLYPGYEVGYNGPVASFRMKMIREGMEDYELLGILKETINTAKGRIGGAAKDYSPDVRLFEYSYSLITPAGRSNQLGKNTPYLQFVSMDYHDFENEREKAFNEISQTLESPLLLVETNPVDNGYKSGAKAFVRGFVEAGAKVTVNGDPVQITDNGFKADITLQPGKNVIKVIATSAGKSKTIERTIFKK